ncbi:MAG TPA: ornithine carbamoyltransferase [Candidatus Limnocylindrales bacterium]|nr:ornithine carbamoyltransferase [Candidatus Limnocylindrales bacterium]
MYRTREAVPAPSVISWHLKPAAGGHKRDFLTLHDITISEMTKLLKLAEEVKANPEAYSMTLRGKMAALIFEKPSLRTRVTFEVGFEQLGGHAVYLAPGDIGLGKRESVGDVARNLSRWVDVMVVRTFSQELLEELAAEASAPIINALTDLLHPCQAIADLMTIREAKGELKGLHLVYVGDGNNVALSLAHAAGKVGMHFTIVCPPDYAPNKEILTEARADAESTGSEIEVVHDPKEVLSTADAIYTDVWTSMGQEKESEERRRAFVGYQVNETLMDLAPAEALFMHCLPAHRGEEVTDEVLDGLQSVVLEQAENRLHAHKAILLALLAGRKKEAAKRVER